MIKLNFDTEIEGEKRTFVVTVPYKNGIVITNEFCPLELITDKVELLAAIRGESLDKFMEICKKQVVAMTKIKDVDSELDRHIGGLMAVVMDKFSRQKEIKLGDLLIHIDCFSLLLKGSGFINEEIREIYPAVFETINNLYPDQIKIDNFVKGKLLKLL